jgi:hypothetical protein
VVSGRLRVIPPVPAVARPAPSVLGIQGVSCKRLGTAKKRNLRVLARLIDIRKSQMVDEFYDKPHFHGFLALYLSITNPDYRGKTGQIETHAFFLYINKNSEQAAVYYGKFNP